MDTLGFCFNLETLDLIGCKGIDEDGARKLCAATVQVGNETVHPGLQNLHTLKISGSTIGPVGLPLLIKALPNLEHVELAKCEQVTEHDIKQIVEKCEKMQYIDITSIPVVKYEFLDELKQANPGLLIRRNVHQDDDFKKDNGLRVPRRIVQKKKAKKKKKKGKKK